MLFIASDHGGYQLKKFLIRNLNNQLKTVATDLGPGEYNEADDYPVFAEKLCKEVRKSKENLGILICKTGHGMCMAANKIKGIRAILGYSIEGAEWGRKHENANVLCLAAKFLSDEHAAAIVKQFLEAEFKPEERHLRRIKMLEALE